MKKDITRPSHLRLLPTLSDTTSESDVVYSHFGHPSHALIPTQDQRTARVNKLRQLSALLNYLEKEVATLQFKLLEVCYTLTDDHNTEDLLAELGSSTSDTTGTEVEDEGKL